MNDTDNVIRIAQIMGKLNAGGVESVIYNYYRHLNHSKIQFDFIIDEDSNVAIPDDILNSGARCFIVPPYQNLVKYISSLKKLFKENKYHIVHSNMTTLAVFSLYAAKKAKVPVRICHSHSSAGKGETLRNVLKYLLRPFAKTYATDYFACSEYAGKWLFGKETFQSGKVKVVNNAVNIDSFKFNQNVRDEVRKELGIENKFIVGHVGRFVTQKNHSFLIDIFNELQKVKKEAVLLLIGDGPMIDEIQEKVKAIGISDKVKFLGIQKSMSKYYQAMDCFVMPSLYEGLPVVCIEAQVSGLPVIASDAMTKETKVASSFSFLSLSDKADLWISEICNVENENRETDISLFEKFDIEVQAKRLEEFYLGKNKCN